MTNAALGMEAEERACLALAAEGWHILGRRMRTKSGEIDAVAEKDGLVAFVEVKSRRTLAAAAEALRPRQQARLLAAAEILLAAHPAWGEGGVRFDVMLVDPQQRIRRIKDAIRLN
jgi:putative endonuclease